MFDFGILGDPSLMPKNTKMLSKYKDLEIKISSMWNNQTKGRAGHSTVGAVGMLKKRFDNKAMH